MGVKDYERKETQEVDALIKKYENPLVQKKIEREISQLYALMRFLRENCPWDKEQTHESLKSDLIEEAYETCEAIDKCDKINLKEELGDVLLHVIFHSILAEETSDFTLDQVISDEIEKMIRRHKYLFCKDDIKTVDKTVENWDNIKRTEHSYTSYTSEMMNIPRKFPALMRSHRVQRKASKVGFDWNEIDGALDKVEEEFQEVKEAYIEGNHIHIEEEIGDLLFAVVNVTRFLDVDGEIALNKATDKFIKRFEIVENLGREQGKDLKEMTLEEMDRLWDKAKLVVSRNS